MARVGRGTPLPSARSDGNRENEISDHRLAKSRRPPHYNSLLKAIAAEAVGRNVSRSTARPTFPGGAGYPLGPSERFQVISSSFPKLRLAHPFQSIEITAARDLEQVQSEVRRP